MNSSTLDCWGHYCTLRITLCNNCFGREGISPISILFKELDFFVLLVYTYMCFYVHVCVYLSVYICVLTYYFS